MNQLFSQTIDAKAGDQVNDLSVKFGGRFSVLITTNSYNYNGVKCNLV